MSDQSSTICINCSFLTCIYTWSAAGNSLQWVGALSKQSATDLLSWSSPGFQESVILADILLTDSRCRPLGRKQASYVASVLIGLEEWLRTASASEQTCPALHYQHLQLLQGFQVFIIHYRWVIAEFADERPHYKHSRFAKQTYSLRHGMLKQHCSQ